MNFANRIFSLFLILTFIIVFYPGCKKTELIEINSGGQSLFFNVPSEVPHLIKQIASKIETQNRQEQFIKEIIEKDGYPIWDKSEIVTPANNEVIAYIPLALKDTRYVNSYIVYRRKDDKAIMQLIRGTRYALYGFSKGFSANAIALDLMRLNKTAFQDSVFEITDSRLFGLNKFENLPRPLLISLQSDKQSLSKALTGAKESKILSRENTYASSNSFSPSQTQPSQIDPIVLGCMISYNNCSGEISATNGWWNCKNVTVNVSGGPCQLPPLDPTPGTGGGGGTIPDEPTGPSGGTSPNGLPGLNIIMPPCPVGMSQADCDARMVPVIRWMENNQNISFANITSPVDVLDEPIIENGIVLEDILFFPPGGGNSRLIGKTQDRGNTEDLQYGTSGDVTGILPIECTKSNDRLFEGMDDLFWWCTFFDGQLGNVGDIMIEKFKTNNNTNYTFENSVLNQKVLNSHSMTNFLKRFGSDLKSKLIESNGNIDAVSTLDVQYRPIFNGTFNKFHGLQILINDTEYTEIALDRFELEPTGTWEADVTVTVNDHFGLDKHDALTYQDHHWGFADWWLLQHTRGYIPYKTKIVIRKRIKGSLF